MSEIRIEVDPDLCDLHAQCVAAAPEIFSLDEEGKLRYLELVDESRLAAAEDAMSICPTAAIEVHR